ncbi:MAG: alkaline phosphatase PhoX [Cyanobacteria bacterium P01_D01_bin.14]
MSLKRRQFLVFLGVAAGTTALGTLNRSNGIVGALGSAPATAAGHRPFNPVKGPMPYGGLGIDPADQPAAYAQYAVKDDLVLPEGYTYDVIGSWGDAVGDSRFGYNNDYLSFVPTGPDEGYLTINFEYISADTWSQTFEAVVGSAPDFATVKAEVEAKGGEVNAYRLPEGPMKAQIREVSKQALTDQGMGVISIRREASGKWVRTNSDADRRITGISGLDNRSRYLKSTGPATAVFQKREGYGHIDGLSTNIIGTFGNCAGGTTPWGTALSAEENIQNQVPEKVYPDGTSFYPLAKKFGAGFEGQGNVLGLAGNKYGWIVEVDPANKYDYGVKHTWLGRYRHEAVGIRANAGEKLAFYSGCDRRGGHLYKFVSTDTVKDPRDKANSRLLTNGMLYAAKFNGDGTGRWIALAPNTPVDPVMPSTVAGGMVTLPKRPLGGFEKVKDDAKAMAFKEQFNRLADLYDGNDREKQGAILIDAHYAANAAGATCTARPEDTMVTADGTLFTAYTSGTPGGDGGPDMAIFKGPNGEVPYEYGWLMKLNEDNNDPAAMTFTWSTFIAGGEEADGGPGFANPDNMEFDNKGNLVIVTDMSTSTHNKAVPSRTDDSGESVSQKTLLGLYGNNSVWFIPTSGDHAGEAMMLGYGPMECEMTGPFLTPDNATLFLAAQHPGERNGIRENMAAEMRQYAMQTTTGQPFMQTREVPLGSNWPDMTENAAPKPSVVAVRRVDGGSLT